MKKNFSVEEIIKDIRTPEGKERFLMALDAVGTIASLQGDFVAIRIIMDLKSLVEPDCSYKDYTRKLQAIEGRMKLYDAVGRAREMIRASGKPVSFAEICRAISDAVDRAVKAFEEKPCPRRAADLLGMVECQNLLLKARVHEDEVTGCGEDDEP